MHRILLASTPAGAGVGGRHQAAPGGQAGHAISSHTMSGAEPVAIDGEELGIVDRGAGSRLMDDGGFEIEALRAKGW